MQQGRSREVYRMPHDCWCGLKRLRRITRILSVFVPSCGSWWPWGYIGMSKGCRSWHLPLFILQEPLRLGAARSRTPMRILRRQSVYGSKSFPSAYIVVELFSSIDDTKIYSAHCNDYGSAARTAWTAETSGRSRTWTFVRLPSSAYYLQP